MNSLEKPFVVIPSILLVEDDELDVELVERAFRKHKLMNPIVNAPNGIIALDILRGNHMDTLVKPYIILLDINMPLMNGLEFLRELRNDKSIAKSIVFVLTTSDSPQDKNEAYACHVAGYILKHNVGSDFINAIRLLENYQFLITLPD